MHHRPKRSLGQNFLRDKKTIDRIIAALDLSPDDHVVEIGPGQGALTGHLLASGAQITAIEFDRDLAPFLRDKFGGAKNFVVVEADALTVDLRSLGNLRSEIGDLKWKLVANLPYNISTPILQRLIAQRELFSLLVLMFQREVADRITAPAGGSSRGYLSVLCEMAFVIERLFDVPPKAFYPAPKVWSSVVRLTPTTAQKEDDGLAALVSSGFRQRRKTLLNNLNALNGPRELLQLAGINPSRRAETLSLAEWRALLAETKKGGAGAPPHRA